MAMNQRQPSASAESATGSVSSGSGSAETVPRGGMVAVRLEHDQLVELAELVADLVVAQLEPATTPGLVDAKTLACALGVERSYVYRHADELGAMRLGDGPRARPRFDVEEARRRLAACHAARESGSAGATPGAVSGRRRRRGSGTRVELLPVRGSDYGR